jgi:two-component system, NarL family, sensor histidine kinase EvgS
VAASRYDLVLTDCHMPGMDGTILASHIRMAEATLGREWTPIIGLTADITDTMRQRCLAAGMDGVEIKPINLKRLELVLRRLFLRQGHDTGLEPVGAASETPVFDQGAYRELFEVGDSEGASWLNGYLQSATAALELIRQSAEADDRGKLGASAHRLAGSSLCVGARRLGELCRQLEALAEHGDPSSLRDLSQRAAAEFDTLRVELTRFISNPAQDAA